jgi:hypothetical protein
MDENATKKEGREAIHLFLFYSALSSPCSLLLPFLPLSSQTRSAYGNSSLKEGGARNATRGVDPRREGCMANHANFGTGQPKHKEWISGGPEGI